MSKKKLSMEELNRLGVEEFKATDKHTAVVVLDNVRSLNNVGSAFRTSDAFLVEKLLLCGITGCPPHRDINKTALGAQETVTWEYHDNTLDALKQLKAEGYKIIVVEQTTGSVMLNEFNPSKEEKVVFVFGNEAFGVDDEVVSFADMSLEIPQYGTKHSLNISVSIGIVLWQYIQSVNG
ncbi:RNA methyltransferase [Limibacter armeniacum]|uniref:RNA methyltransferase n=1 Tax=Limibacter armeniacum TaxID=466084 RepID=UPI002FE6020E